MSLLKWQDQYSVGNDEFDSHHKALFSLMDQVSRMLSEEVSEVSINQIIKELIDYTVYHFSAEEHQMIASKYPQYEQHKYLHDNFISNLNRIIERTDYSPYKKLEEIYITLSQWLVNHIMNEDQKYQGKL